MTFSQKVLQYIHPGHKVLDLGAGDGWFARECLMQQAVVTAVDLKPPPVLDRDIDWHTMNVKDFLDRLPTRELFQVIYSRNLIQFLDNAWVRDSLLPQLIQHLQPGGILAIQTFYRDPEPAFKSTAPSLFTVDDLTALLRQLHMVYAREFSETSPDMIGVSRKFFITNMITQK